VRSAAIFPSVLLLPRVLMTNQNAFTGPTFSWFWRLQVLCSLGGPMHRIPSDHVAYPHSCTAFRNTMGTEDSTMCCYPATSDNILSMKNRPFISQVLQPPCVMYDFMTKFKIVPPNASRARSKSLIDAIYSSAKKPRDWLFKYQFAIYNTAFG